MNYQWKIKPQVDSALAAEFKLPLVVVQLLYNRGLTDAESIEMFLENKAKPHDQFLFKDMKLACQLIINCIKNGELIAIAGDYDADGVTASAVLTEVLGLLKAKTKVWIPSRHGDGYGLNKRIIDEITADGAKLLITVDNGIKNREEVAYAKTKNLSVIITDHHEPPSPDKSASSADKLPDCLIINPLVADDTYPFKQLAGCGVAYKLACALVAMSTLDEAVKQQILDKVLDLVAVGTIGDCVNLLGENRPLVKRGLEILNRSARLGLRELCRAAALKYPLTEWNVTWQIVPRLNVAGRLDHANTAYELLITADRDEAVALAKRLNEQNITRQNLTKNIFEECQQLVEKEMINDKCLIMLSPELRRESLQLRSPEEAKDWPEGVIGLVAGRLAEKYARPSFLLVKAGGKIKGSGRSAADFNLVAALEKLDQYLERHGGHKQAAGFTVKADELENFIKGIKELAEKQLVGLDLTPTLPIEAELTLPDIDDNLMHYLERFAPFGFGNPIPVFSANDLMVDELQTFGSDNQHLKLRFDNLWAVGFSNANKWPQLTRGDKINLIFELMRDDFNGNKGIKLKIIDLQIV